MSKDKKRDVAWECEVEHARMRRLKRRLARMKEDAKKFSKKHKEDPAYSDIIIPKGKIKVKTKPIKIKKTYEVLDRVEIDGWPMFKLKRNTDGKTKVVNVAKFRKLQKKGKITGFVPAPRVNQKFQHARTPRGHFAIQCGAEGYRVDIVYSISKDWKDLMCYHHKFQRMMHLKREDLYPKENVDEAILFLQRLDEQERTATKSNDNSGT